MKFRIIVFILLVETNVGLGMFLGGGCGCRPPPCPLPPPPPVNSKVFYLYELQVCPGPILPPPCFCPNIPPPPCPAPIPCPPPISCPMMPPPSPCGGGYAIGYQQPEPSYSYAPAINDCCCQCGSPCRFQMRAKTHGSKIFSAMTAEVAEDPTCNNEKLRMAIEENITKDPSESKRAIQAAAEEKLFTKINVICAKADFSYVAYTDQYCQASSGDVTCYAFRPIAPKE